MGIRKRGEESVERPLVALLAGTKLAQLVAIAFLHTKRKPFGTARFEGVTLTRQENAEYRARRFPQTRLSLSKEDS
jgi:hypothetical protein